MAEGLERFVAAQEPVWTQVVSELAEGRKRSHWMWFVFPQIAGLGKSATVRALRARLAGRGGRLPRPPRARRAAAGGDRPDARPRRSPADTILGGIDAVKFRSSMTLFHAAAPAEDRFANALAVFFAGAEDPRTRAILDAQER